MFKAFLVVVPPPSVWYNIDSIRIRRQTQDPTPIPPVKLLTSYEAFAKQA